MKRRQWLIDLRNEMDLTQEQLAERAGVERSTLTKAENGSSVSIKTAKKIASAVGCSWTIFFEGNCDVSGHNNQSATSA